MELEQPQQLITMIVHNSKLSTKNEQNETIHFPWYLLNNSKKKISLQNS